MTEGQRQAIYRLITVAAAAAVSAILVNIGPLVDLITDPTWRTLALVALTAILQGLLKLLGGATEPVSPMLTAGVRARRVRWWAA